MTTLGRNVAAYPSAPYVAPFVIFVALLGLSSLVPEPLAAELIRLAVMTLAILLIARPVLDFSLKAPVASVLLGIAVFAIWIIPDLLFPGYRHFMENAITGAAKSSMSAAALASAPVLTLRSIRAVVIVPIVEELFWRA